jgi:arabinofuranosyltransferase
MRKAAEFLTGPRMLICIPLVLFLSLALACYHFTVDDAFISFRCAKNLAQGNGLVFNVGERVEAFSNPLWVLILSLASLMRIDIVAASKLLGIGCGVLTLVLLMRLCLGVFRLSRAATLVALCYAATNISIVYSAISGLETAFYTASLVLMIYLLTEKREMLAGVACALLALTRPEGILYAMPLAIGCRLNGCGFRRMLTVLCIPAGAYGLFASFSLLYYGTLLPNSYNAKIGALPASIEPSISRARAFIQYSWYVSTVQEPVLFLSFIGGLALFNRRLAPMFGAMGVAAFFVWYSKGDWMSFWRFYTPIVPFLAVFWVGALELIRLSLGRSRKAKVFLAVLLLPLIMSVARTVKSVDALKSGTEFNPAMHSREHARIGAYLASVSSPSDVVVANEIGAISYYSGLATVDMLGLTDRRVPLLLRRGDLDAYADYILSREPAFIVLNDRQAPGEKELHPVHAAVYRKMMETKLYRLDRQFPLNSFKNALLFAREKGNPAR